MGAEPEFISQDIYQTQCNEAFQQDFDFSEIIFEDEDYWQSYLEELGILNDGEMVELGNVDIVVIGAGMSGLTATKGIIDHNHKCKLDRHYTKDPKSCDTSYVLLEATDRVGGVIKMNQGFFDESSARKSSKKATSKKTTSKKTTSGSEDNDFRQKITLEDGPNWIGGDVGNPVFDYAMNFVDPPLRVFPQDFYDMIAFTNLGETVQRSDIIQGLRRYERNFAPGLNAIATNTSHPAVINGTSIRDVLFNELGFFLREGKEDIDEFVLWYQIDLSDGGSAADSSVVTWPIHTFYTLFDDPLDNDPNYVHAFGGYYMEYLGVDERGLEAIPKTFAEKELKISSNDRIMMGEEVCKVMHKDDLAIVITSSNKVFRTKKFISTINPTLYLNEAIVDGVNNRSLFQPALYENVTDFPFLFGKYQMIYYQFPSKFWENFEFINVVYPADQVGRCGWFQNLSFQSTKQQFQNSYPFDDDAPTVLSDNPGIDRFNWVGPDSYILKCLLATSAYNDLDQGLTNHLVLNDLLEPLRIRYNSTFVEPKKVYLPENFKGDNVDSYLVGTKVGVGAAERDHFHNIGSRSIHVSGTQVCTAWAGWIHGAWGAGFLSAAEALDDLHEDIHVPIPHDCVPLNEYHYSYDPRYNTNFD